MFEATRIAKENRAQHAVIKSASNPSRGRGCRMLPNTPGVGEGHAALVSARVQPSLVPVGVRNGSCSRVTLELFSVADDMVLAVVIGRLSDERVLGLGSRYQRLYVHQDGDRSRRTESLMMRAARRGSSRSLCWHTNSLQLSLSRKIASSSRYSARSAHPVPCRFNMGGLTAQPAYRSYSEGWTIAPNSNNAQSSSCVGALVGTSLSIARTAQHSAA